MSLDIYMTFEANIGGPEPYNVEIFETNITHNLVKMAEEADIYLCMWRPDEMGITLAAQMIGHLELGLSLLESDPERFKTFNPSNGWGDYDGLVRVVKAYLAACKASPKATISVWR